jgi:uncharacterized cofD-like protein
MIDRPLRLVALGGGTGMDPVLGGLREHTTGMTAVVSTPDKGGSFERLLGSRGRVLPVTRTDTTLCATLAGGHEIRGKSAIDIRKSHHGVPIAHVCLRPPAAVNPPVLDAIARADLIVLGPGDLYTGVIPTLLVEGVAEAIRSAPGVRVYVTNVMTKHGETDGYTAGDHLAAIIRYLGGRDALDCAVLNYHERLPQALYERYREQRSETVTIDLARCYELVPHLAVHPLAATGTLVRHDPGRLAAVLVDLAHALGRAPVPSLPRTA